ncbi:MAG TPA: periplasmic heavy metal sensor [Thermoanaerobaculia bacterium]|nr:periplasmic heavy metal sensor [Thermoanaerobaculia bacterium]
MKKKLFLTAAVIAMAAFAIVPFVYAGPGGGHMRGHGFGGGEGHGLGMFGHLAAMREKLDLSDQQVDQLKAIFADAHQQNAQYRDQLHGGMQAIAQRLLDNPNDLAGAQAALDQQAAAENAMKANLLQATSKALNVLTPDQRATLSTMLRERAERWEARKR